MSQHDTLWTLLSVSSKRTWFLLQIRFSCGFVLYVVQGKCFKLWLVGNEWILYQLCCSECWWLSAHMCPNDMLWAILLVSSVRALILLRIRLEYSPGEVFQALIGGKRIDIASVVSYSVLLVECAQVPKWHGMSNIVSFVSKIVDSLADSTRI
jgi:hypothetical protein